MGQAEGKRGGRFWISHPLERHGDFGGLCPLSLPLSLSLSLFLSPSSLLFLLSPGRQLCFCAQLLSNQEPVYQKKKNRQAISPDYIISGLPAKSAAPPPSSTTSYVLPPNIAPSTPGLINFHHTSRTHWNILQIYFLF